MRAQRVERSWSAGQQLASAFRIARRNDLKRFSTSWLADVVEKPLPMDQTRVNLLLLVGEVDLAGPNLTVEVFE